MEHLKSLSEISEICKEYGIWNWSLEVDGKVRVNGYADLSSEGLTKLPLSFSEVTGDFYCNSNKLTTLERCPKSVGRSFYCTHNGLTSLEGCPREVGRHFDCSGNKLTSLEGCPKEVGVGFYCINNQLTSLEGCPQQVGGNFYCDHNQISTLSIDFRIDVKGDIYFGNNPLPPEILNLGHNQRRWLFKYVHEYPYLWKNGQFNQYWWNELKLSMDDELNSTN